MNVSHASSNAFRHAVHRRERLVLGKTGSYPMGVASFVARKAVHCDISENVTTMEYRDPAHPFVNLLGPGQECRQRARDQSWPGG